MDVTLPLTLYDTESVKISYTASLTPYVGTLFTLSRSLEPLSMGIFIGS